MGAIANLFGYLLNFLYNIFNNYVITDKENHEYELKETRIVITYYIEGWDKDNTDLVCEGNFLSNLVFEADYARSDIYS